MDASSRFSGELTKSQKTAYLGSHILALLSVLVVIWWINFAALGGGGVSWTYGESGRVFNWHPVLMITAFAFMTVATTIYRRPAQSSSTGQDYRKLYKLVHGISWLVALLCGGIGVVAVFRSHNDPISGYIANLYSMHSWFGIVTIVMYLFQFSVGVKFFALGADRTFGNDTNKASQWKERKQKVMNFHKLFGSCIYYMTSATILLGIMEKEGFVGCGYKVTSADVIPFSHLGDIPGACTVSHSLGLIIALMTICTGYVMHNFPIISNEEASSLIV